MVEALYLKDDFIAAAVRAEVLSKNGRAHQPQTFHRRSEQTQRLVAATFPDPTQRQGHQLAALLRILAGGRTWLQLRETFGLGGAESGPLVAWAIGALLAEVCRGNPLIEANANCAESASCAALHPNRTNKIMIATTDRTAGQRISTRARKARIRHDRPSACAGKRGTPRPAGLRGR